MKLDRRRLVSLLALAMLFPLILLVGQFPVLRGHRHLVGLFHFEEHRRRGTVLHGPEFTERGRAFLGSQHEDVTKSIKWLTVWVGAVNPSHLFLVLNLTEVFCSLACSSLGSIPSLSGWFHCLCFCRRTFVANTASQ